MKQETYDEHGNLIDVIDTPYSTDGDVVESTPISQEVSNIPETHQVPLELATYFNLDDTKVEVFCNVLSPSEGIVSEYKTIKEDFNGVEYEVEYIPLRDYFPNVTYFNISNKLLTVELQYAENEISILTAPSSHSRFNYVSKGANGIVRADIPPKGKWIYTGGNITAGKLIVH